MRPSNPIGMTAEPSASTLRLWGIARAGKAARRSSAVAWNSGVPVRITSVMGTGVLSGTRIHGWTDSVL